MAIFKPIAGLLTSSSDRKARGRINDRRSNIAQVRRRQARRAFLNQFRTAQANAILSGTIGEGGAGMTSGSLQAAASIGTQARTADLEERLQFGFAQAIGEEMETLDRNTTIRGLAGAVDAIAQFATRAPGLENSTFSDFFS